MSQRVVKLLAELAAIRRAEGAVGPDHPRFKKWLAEAGTLTEGAEDGSPAAAFGRLPFGRGNDQMWRGGLLNQRDAKEFLKGLDRAAEILEQMQDGGRNGSAGEHASRPPDRGAPVAAATTPPPEPTAAAAEQGRIGAKTMTPESAAPAGDDLERRFLVSVSRSQTIDGLLARLEREMKSERADWDKIQEIMDEIASLKRTDALLKRLAAGFSAADPEWKEIRDCLRQLWGIRKSVVIDLLPTMLGV